MEASTDLPAALLLTAMTFCLQEWQTLPSPVRETIIPSASQIPTRKPSAEGSPRRETLIVACCNHLEMEANNKPYLVKRARNPPGNESRLTAS